MADKITPSFVTKLNPPKAGNKVYWDSELKGFGVRITASGAISFVINYRNQGRQRRHTFAPYYSNITDVKQTRLDAGEMLSDIKKYDYDPLIAKRQACDVLTMNELSEEFIVKYAEIYKSSRSISIDKSLTKQYITPTIGSLLITQITRADIERIHLRLKKHKYQANRVLSLLSKMFNLAIEWDLLQNNPTKGIKHYREEKRERFLSTDEIKRLATELDKLEAKSAKTYAQSANAIRLILLTGCRRGEALQATWSEINFEDGVWIKPSHHTKQKKQERIPLSSAALTLLANMKKVATSEYIFPSKVTAGPQQDIKNFWITVCKKANLKNVRVHDLRHTYASHLVSSGLSLHIVGKLLGHTQVGTTQRYAHLADSPLREATERFGAIFTGEKQEDNVVVLKNKLAES